MNILPFLLHTLRDPGENAQRLSFESWSALMDFTMRGLEIAPDDTGSFPLPAHN